MRQRLETQRGEASRLRLDRDFMHILVRIGAFYEDRVVVQQFELNTICHLNDDHVGCVRAFESNQSVGSQWSADTVRAGHSVAAIGGAGRDGTVCRLDEVRYSADDELRRL